MAQWLPRASILLSLAVVPVAAGLVVGGTAGVPLPAATYTLYPTATVTPGATPIPVSTPVASASMEFTDLVHKVKAAVVSITTYKDDLKLAVGSGFFVSPNEIITNCHVIESANRVEVRTLEGEVLTVQMVTSYNQDKDLVRLKVQTPTRAAEPLKISAGNPSDGERIVVVGSPLGLEQTVSDGIVSATRDLPPFGSVLQITAPISPGNSGGPVVNVHGEVVGVVRMQASRGQNLNFAVPASEVSRLPTVSPQTLQQYSGGGRVVTVRSAAVQTLELFWQALDGRNFNTVWNLMSRDSQRQLVTSLAKSENRTAERTRTLLEGGGDSHDYDVIWNAFRNSTLAELTAGAVYSSMGEDGDTATVQQVSRAGTRIFLMFREGGSWKVGWTESIEYNKKTSP